MMSLAGMSDAQARADRVLALETEIAKVHWTRADRRDADKIYNPMTVSDLKTLAPDFAWDAFLAEGAYPADDAGRRERYVIVAEKTAFEPLAKIFAAHAGLDLARLSDGALSAALSRPICPSASTTAISRSTARCWAARTQQLDRPDARRASARPADGRGLGQALCRPLFPAASPRPRPIALVSNLLKAYEADIQTLDWMSPATRAKALEKIQQFTPKIGYPDQLARLFGAMTSSATI